MVLLVVGRWLSDIKGLHVLVMMPLLVAEPSVNSVMCCLEGVLHFGFTFLKGHL